MINNLMLRRARSARLEAWAADLVLGPPFETPRGVYPEGFRGARLLRVRLRVMRS
jgi:hypothetical protein